MYALCRRKADCHLQFKWLQLRHGVVYIPPRGWIVLTIRGAAIVGGDKYSPTAQLRAKVAEAPRSIMAECS